MTRRGKWVKRNALRYLAYREQVKTTARQHFRDPEPWTGPIGLRVIAYCWGGRPGDLDNIVKAIQDGLNGVVWCDDGQVVKLEAERRKGRPERAEIWVWREEALNDAG